MQLVKRIGWLGNKLWQVPMSKPMIPCKDWRVSMLQAPSRSKHQGELGLFRILFA